MPIVRGKSYEVENGIIVNSADDRGHLSSAIGIPTHSGLKGDFYFDGDTGLFWYLPADGTGWVTVTAIGIPVFSVQLQHQGNVSNGTFYGYAANTPGDSTPVVIFRKSRLDYFSFSNTRDTADYDIEFRINTTVGTPFQTISKVDTQFFAQNMTSAQVFQQGDRIYVKNIGTGTSPADVAISLGFTGIV